MIRRQFLLLFSPLLLWGRERINRGEREITIRREPTGVWVIYGLAPDTGIWFAHTFDSPGKAMDAAMRYITSDLT